MSCGITLEKIENPEQVAQATTNSGDSVHIVSSIETPDFGGMTLRVGDLNGDGAPDLLLTQSEYGSREIRCLTAMSITGALLWQTGNPSAANGRVYSDLPVQVYDWDSRDEVIVVGWKGVRIYANARPLALPTLYNTTLYRGM
jgi:hypothetical protein